MNAETRRRRADQEELAERIARAAPHEGTVEERHFGEPPMRDVGGMRELATA